MMDRDIEKALNQAGICNTFTDANNNLQQVSQNTLTELLQIITVDHSINDLSRPLPTAKIFYLGQQYLVAINNLEAKITLITENGDSEQLTLTNHSTITLPDTLSLGYHKLILQEGANEWICLIVIAPRNCYEPVELEHNKVWGSCLQLYSLRSEQNWGIGDFSDLKRFIAHIAKFKGAFVGLNPIHALYPSFPEEASPYSPSSRRWLNFIYIDVTQVAEFQQSKTVQIWWSNKKIQHYCQKLRNANWVNYTSVIRLKITALRVLWKTFLALHQENPRQKAFCQFIQIGSDSLKHQAIFDALQEKFRNKYWQNWPEEYQSANSPTVNLFEQNNPDNIQFYMWLQWLTELQLAECQQSCKENNMPIGIYRDLAVGVSLSSAETWANQQLYSKNVSIGAPADPLGPQGQNWQLSPMNPHILIKSAYQPFIELLQANMRHCGALRIDHVMSLLRLWWIPNNHSADQGAYVTYPIDELLAILALESQRNKCMVIGEDLGIVPNEIVNKLRNASIYSYKVLYFEQENNVFKLPQQYTPQAIAVLTTHDLPTIKGYWQANDLKIGKLLNIYTDLNILNKLFTEREENKQKLINTFVDNSCLPRKDNNIIANELEIDNSLKQAFHTYIAKCSSKIVGFQPEDWLDMSTPTNIPGTNREYPNWRRKLTSSIEEITNNNEISLLLQKIRDSRL